MLLTVTATPHPRIMPRLQSCLDGVHGGIEEPMGSVSCRPFRSVGLGLHPVVVVPGGVTGGRERMAVSGMGFSIDGSGSDICPRRRRRLTVAPELEEGGDDPRSTHHRDKGLTDGGLLH